MSRKWIIAIDGPAASGKGTLARRLSEHIGVPYLDTGLLYRAVARDVLARGESLEVVSTHDAGTFVSQPGTTPLLVCDLWEHAYYLDHQNDRGGFLEDWWDRLSNWDLAEQQYAAARGEGPTWTYSPARDV